MSKSGVRPRTIVSESTWTSRSWSSRSRFGVSPTYTGRTPSAAMTGAGAFESGHRDLRQVQLDDVGPVLGDERTAPSVETGRSLDIKPAGFPEYVRARERACPHRPTSVLGVNHLRAKARRGARRMPSPRDSSRRPPAASIVQRA